MMSWIPDSIIVRFQYFIATGRFPDLRNPKTFSEKLQVYKLYYRNPEMLIGTDKVEARTLVEKRGLKEILVPVIGIYENVKEIDFKKLPEKFVIKTSDGGGGNQVYICRDKSKEDLGLLLQKVEGWMKEPKPKKHIAREWAYDNGFKRRIMVEELLEQKDEYDIDDLKFYCFDGKVKYFQWHKDRHIKHKIGHYDENLNFLPEVYFCYDSFDKAIPLPENINKFIEVAEKLAKGFPYVRVDLYRVNEKIYFSELTFYPGSGYYPYSPLSFEEKLGSYITYPFQ